MRAWWPQHSDEAVGSTVWSTTVSSSVVSVYVQRLQTRGGVAPTGVCDPASDSTVAVPYRARYVYAG
jgi:hypothetical protein